MFERVRQIYESGGLIAGTSAGASAMCETMIVDGSDEKSHRVEDSLRLAPGLRMHIYPSEGKPRDVGAAIIDTLYPAGADGRIPILSVTGTNGKTTVTRMIGHALAQAGQTVGMTTTDGIYIGGSRIVEGDTTGPHSARTVLADPAVEVAVLETARGGIVRRGLGYDWSDISVITNIGPDHIGQDGIESVEDILDIKALVAERVRTGGTLILNADDERLARLAESRRVREPERNIVYFSLDANSPLISDHVAVGGTAYYLREERIAEVVGNMANPLVHVSDVPITMEGAAAFQVANVLAATAACRAYGLSVEQVASSMMSFTSGDNNPGRANLYRVKNGYVMVDYGHNPDAFAAICRMAAGWNDRRVTGIIGVPGDRDDSVIEQAGKAAARGFDRIIMKEDHDLRGRRKGEVADLLCRAAHSEARSTECLIVFDEADALSRQLEEMRDGQVIVIFYDKLDPILEVLEGYGAQPAANIALEGTEPFESLAVMTGVSGLS